MANHRCNLLKGGVIDAETLVKVLGAIAACVAALIAIWGLLKEIVRIIRELLRLKSARLKDSRWEGKYPGDLFDDWDFTGELCLGKNDGSGRIPVSGQIHWMLKDCSSQLPWFHHIGKSTYEVVEGELKNGILTLSGTKLIGETSDLVELSNYTINCPSKGTAFEGNSKPKRGNKYPGHMCGNIYFSCKPIFPA